MLFYHGHAPRRRDRSAKFVRRSRPGVHRFSGREYRGYRIDLWRRRLGLAVQRVLYSVSITGPEGERIAYLTDFSTAEQACQAAETWINRELPRREPWHKRWPRPAIEPTRHPAAPTTPTRTTGR